MSLLQGPLVGQAGDGGLGQGLHLEREVLLLDELKASQA